MISDKVQTTLRHFNISAERYSDFWSGAKLAELYNRLFHNGNCDKLNNKLFGKQEGKTGNFIINLNILLKFMRKDPKLQGDAYLNSISTFNLVEHEQQMQKFVQWMIQKADHVEHEFKIIKNDGLSPKKVQREYQQKANEFQNLYFAAHLDSGEDKDSLDNEDDGMKVRKKGSFKIIKPKFIPSEQPSQAKIDELKEISMINTENIFHSEEKDDLNSRKTIPKMAQKPPIYRSKQKEKENIQNQSTQNKKQSSSFKQTPYVALQNSNFTSQTSQKKDSVQKSIELIEQQIRSEELSLTQIENKSQIKHKHQNNQENMNSVKRFSSKKIFKMQIPEISQKSKIKIVEWLIGLQLINRMCLQDITQLYEISKNGIVFTEILSFFKPRGSNLCFFQNPKRSAQIHSNYQKIFSTLHSNPHFYSELTYAYEYFVPSAQEKAFWSFLESVFKCFSKKNKSINGFNTQNSLKKELHKSNSIRSSRKQSERSNSPADSHRMELKNVFSSVQLTKKPSKTDFIKLPAQSAKNYCHSELIQNEEPQQDREQKGYKQIYLNKFKNIETPKKQLNNHQSSISMSRSRVKSLSSIKKQEIKPKMPSINLQMQMKVLKYLATLEHQINLHEENVELFKDPFRNGVLINHILIKQHQLINFSFVKKPKSIQDCRNNMKIALNQIKNKIENFPNAYSHYIEQVIKGEISLLYGIIFEIINSKNQMKPASNTFKIYPSKDIVPQYNFFEDQIELQDSNVSWVKQISKVCPKIAELKIKDEENLINSLIGSQFLYFYAEYLTKTSINPSYEHPLTMIQKQSNLKKILGFLSQHKIIKSDHIWKTKLIIKKQLKYINELLADLTIGWKNFERKNPCQVTFSKNEHQKGENDRLDTTMANKTVFQPHTDRMQTDLIEISWMRKLGFRGDLSLNNGVILCQLVSRLSMKTISGVIQNPQSKAECLNNIRKAIKELPKFQWDQLDIFEGTKALQIEVYGFLKQKYKHSYAMKFV